VYQQLHLEVLHPPLPQPQPPAGAILTGDFTALIGGKRTSTAVTTAAKA
jgi:hypothetical protein